MTATAHFVIVAIPHQLPPSAYTVDDIDELRDQASSMLAEMQQTRSADELARCYSGVHVVLDSDGLADAALDGGATASECAAIIGHDLHACMALDRDAAVRAFEHGWSASRNDGGHGYAAVRGKLWRALVAAEFVHAAQCHDCGECGYHVDTTAGQRIVNGETLYTVPASETYLMVDAIGRLVCDACATDEDAE